MIGKDVLNNALLESESDQSDIIIKSPALEVLAPGEPMDLDDDNQDLLQAGYSPFIIRLSESFLRSRVVLNNMGDEPFEIFVRRYSVHVEEGLELFQRFIRLYEDIDEKDYNHDTVAEALVEIDPESELNDLPAQAKLSIFDQLELIVARWRTHEWIMQNLEFIKWCQTRNSYYALLFAQMPGQKIILNGVSKALDLVELEYLFNLVFPHLNSVSLEEDIVNLLNHPTHKEALLDFSAKIDQIEGIKVFREKADSIVVLRLLTLIEQNRAFFKNLVVNENTFKAIFAKYIHANTAAKQFLKSVRTLDHLRKLSTLVDTQDFETVRNHPALIEYYRPLFNTLLEGLLNGRLELLIKLWKFSLNSQPHEFEYLKALTWLEMNREVIALSFIENSSFAQWVDQQPESIRANMIAFSQPLVDMLTATHPVELEVKDDDGRVTRQVYLVPDCFDARPGKVSLSTFPSPLACFQDAISGLPAKDRYTLVSTFTGDVLLDVFLSHPQNLPVLAHIKTQFHPQDSLPADKRVPVVQPTIQAYQQSLAEQRVQMIDRALPRPLQDAINNPHPINARLAPRLLRKVKLPPQDAQQRRIDMENDRLLEEEQRREQNCVGMVP